MMLVLVFFVMSLLLEVCLPFVHVSHLFAKRFIAAVIIGLLLASSAYLVWNYPSGWSVIFAILTLYRIFNVLRIVTARMHPVYLRRVCSLTTIWLAAGQIGTMSLLYVLSEALIPAVILTVMAMLLALVGSVTIYITVRGHVNRTAQLAEPSHYSSATIPSVTVAISARNETDSLLACIESILASDYPKLEILVLDDCSQQRRTAEIIRGFAHAGVRFIPGDEPKPGWLARNQAYDVLARAASGSYIFYCNTSVRIEPSTVRTLVAMATARDRSMVSVMPRYALAPGQISLIEPMRAAWELLVPRSLVSRPPVFSPCWLIRADALQAWGGFRAVSRMVAPESYFARAANTAHSYDFVADGAAYGIYGESTIQEQRSTGIRTSYPALRRRPEMVASVSLLTAIIVAAPFVAMLGGVMLHDLSVAWRIAAVLAGIGAAVLLLAAYRQVLQLTYGSARLSQVVSFPAAVVTAIGLLHYSMYKYEFSEVIWKERNICLPVMHVVPSLPKI
jgi:hypothetical protein